VLAFKEKLTGEDPQGSNFRLMPRRNGEVMAEPEAIRDLFLELGSRLCETQGLPRGLPDAGADDGVCGGAGVFRAGRILSGDLV
jgi:hypothetical protein